MFALSACDSASISDAEAPEIPGANGVRTVSSSEMLPFQASGSVGGGVLPVGVFYPPTNGGESKLVRTSDFVEYTINTTGLPMGAYTVWTILLNKPENCLTTPCSLVDLFQRQEETDGSAYWGTGGVVEASGHGYFKARVPKGFFPTNPDQIAWPGSGLQNPMGAEFHLLVKYHGLASDDPDMLYAQTHTLLGGCSEGANALGVHCFDPQLVIHLP